MLGKIYLVLDFDNEAQKVAAQEAFKELSNMRVVTGRQVVDIWPFVQAHEVEIAELFQMISTNGAKAVLSFRGAQIINNLRK